MTTSKVIFSSPKSDGNYTTGMSALVSALLVSAMSVAFYNATSAPTLAFVMGIMSFVMTFAIAMFRNKLYANKHSEFIQSVSEAVKKETGHTMTPKSVMTFLFSGKAADDNGAVLTVQHTKDEVTILLTK